MKAKLRIETDSYPDIFIFTVCEYEYHRDGVAIISFEERDDFASAKYVIGLHKDKITLGISAISGFGEDPIKRFDVYALGAGYPPLKEIEFGAWSATFLYEGSVCQYDAESAHAEIVCLIEQEGVTEKSRNILKIDLKVV